MFSKMIRKWLSLPDLSHDDDIDAPSTTEKHRTIIWEKKFLRRIYIDIYQKYEQVIAGNPNGRFIELGSGGGFAKKICPEVITSDILVLNELDVCCSVEAMPFADQSIDGFFMVNVFHHIKNPRNLLNEISRCLKPGGVVFMLEPANTWWGRYFFQNFHHEDFDPKAGWLIEGDGPMSCANGALPWIVFVRDHDQFKREYPHLQLQSIKYHSPIIYLLSGGVSMRQLVPSFSYPLVKFFELLLSPFHRWIGMFSYITLQRKS